MNELIADGRSALGYDRILLVREPWVSKLVDGEKTWELRRSSTRVRGAIGLAASGSSHVMGEAELVAAHGPFSPDELRKHRDRHRVPDEFLFEYAKNGKLFAWEFADARRFHLPVPYVHPPGAVIWVKVR